MRCLAIAFLVGSLPAFAQDSAQYRACNEKAKVQAEMNACASDEAARVDAELNRVYQKLLSQAASQPEVGNGGSRHIHHHRRRVEALPAAKPCAGTVGGDQ